MFRPQFFSFSVSLLYIAAVGLGHANAQTTADETDTKVEPEQSRPAINFRVLQSWELNLGNRSIFYNRVAPPQPLPPRPPQPVPEAQPLTPEEAAPADARARKKFEALFLSATVYDRRVTELRWWFENREYRAWSNVDFNYLAGAGEIETEDSVYWLIMGLGNDTAESIAAANERAAAEGWNSRKDLPSPERFNPVRAEYFLANDSKSPEPSVEALAAIDALHRYYDANRTRLAEEYAKREAARIAQEQWLKEHPPVPKDTVINFWPKKSRTYPTTGK
jgi:hypothetical protein